MIVVIADDFTGAAEMSGIGIRYGLNCEIHSKIPEESEAELLIFAINTRSMSGEKASSEIKKILEKINSFPVDWIYKKVDSVLRGHILEEIGVVKEMLGNDKVLLVPANPSLGRTISGGNYFIHNQPLHETDLRYDLPRERNTSKVLTLLGATEANGVRSLKPDSPSLDAQFIIGDATSKEDLKRWAERTIEDQRILGGAAEFFNALLQMKGYETKALQSYSPVASARYLFVCGSASTYSKNHISDAIKRGNGVCEIPEELFYSKQPSKELMNQWADDVIKSFFHHQHVMVAINKPLVKDADLSKRLVYYIACLVEIVLKKLDIEELLIEGGATAASIIKQLQVDTFIPLQELSPGVVRMSVASKPLLNLTIKPGSYVWPDFFLNSLKD